MDTQKYVKTYLEKLIPSFPNKSKNKKKTVALIGLGPHAKRIYLHYLKKHKIDLGLVVELHSKKDGIRLYLDEQGFKNTKIFTIADSIKDDDHLPKDVASNLLSVCDTLEITNIVIATEPKAHNMYIEFALKNNIDVMTDKPITVKKNMLSINTINKVRKQYYDLLKLAEKSNAICMVMCQRQYHKGYEYIKELLSEIVVKYQVPITFIDIYHCDGNWEMAHDLDKENHPYKYGYGKLFHSGYHFIDLLSDFIKINNQLKGTKKIAKGEVYSNCFTPEDESNVFNFDDYKRIFKEQRIPEYYIEGKKQNFKKYGEKNYYGLMKFSNLYNQTITNVNLSLLHYGFSRRGWIETKEFYKKNGRIRHERINIQVGALMNIQVHSYQAKEISERTNNLAEENVGGLEHFDIDIYRNVDVIGGKPFERISLGNLYTEGEKQNILGYNELSREECLTQFLKGNNSKGNIKDQALAIEILYSCAVGISNHYYSKKVPQSIDVRNQHIYPVKIDDFKELSIEFEKNVDKTNVKIYPIMDNNYEFNVVMNLIKKDKTYEVYLCVENDKDIVSGILYKKLRYSFFANLYFNILKIKVSSKRIYRICKK